MLIRTFKHQGADIIISFHNGHYEGEWRLGTTRGSVSKATESDCVEAARVAINEAIVKQAERCENGDGEPVVKGTTVCWHCQSDEGSWELEFDDWFYEHEDDAWQNGTCQQAWIQHDKDWRHFVLEVNHVTLGYFPSLPAAVAGWESTKGF